MNPIIEASPMRTLRQLLFGWYAAATLAVLPVAAQTVTYSLADDFSYTDNRTDSTWSYRMDDWQTAPPAFLPLLNSNTRDANEVWGTDFPNPPTLWSEAEGYWGIGKNLTGAQQYSGLTGTYWEPGEVLFWPKGGNTPPSRMVIAWTSPLTGTMDLNYTFDRASEIGNGIGYSLLYRSRGIDAELVGFTQIGVTFTDSRAGLTVTKGDQLFFRFDSWGPHDGDISRANILITVTPATYSTKPEIRSQPAGGTGFLGLGFTFSVSATDVESYQWRKEGQPIAGATSASYTIDPLKADDAGIYSVVVSNPLGSVTSTDATLNVVPAPVQPVYSLAADFSLANNGGNQPWSYGYDEVASEPVRFAALTNSTLNANDLWGTDFANPPRLWSSEPTQYGGIGRNTSGVVQTSSSGITWNPDEVLLRPKATDPFPGRLTLRWTAPADLTIDVDFAFERALDAGSVGYSLVKRTSEGDAFLVTWTGQTSGGALSNSLSGLTVSTGDKLFWRIDSWGGAVEDDITKASIIITPATYSTPPAILSQPAGGTGFPGFPFTFGVSATNVQSYQWRKDGQPIAGATYPSYTIERLETGDAGAYSVVLSNPLGSVTSEDAVLDVVPAIVLSTYSLADDFSLANNGGSNPWSYGQDNVAGEPVQFLPLTDNTLSANDLWATDFANPPTLWSDATGYWGIGKNTSGVVQTSSSGIAWNPDEVLLRPKATAPFPGRLVIGWIAPTNHTVNLIFTFERALEAGSVGYSLIKRTGAEDTFVVNWTGQTSGGALSNSFGLTVSTGDQLFWRIDSWGGAEEEDITRATIDIQVLGPAPAAPRLGIQRAVAQNTVIVSWPASASDYALQSSTNANGPYAAYTGTISTVGNEFNATVPVGPARAFFRLWKP